MKLDLNNNSNHFNNNNNYINYNCNNSNHCNNSLYINNSNYCCGYNNSFNTSNMPFQNVYPLGCVAVPNVHNNNNNNNNNSLYNNNNYGVMDHYNVNYNNYHSSYHPINNYTAPTYNGLYMTYNNLSLLPVSDTFCKSSSSSRSECSVSISDDFNCLKKTLNHHAMTPSLAEISLSPRERILYNELIRLENDNERQLIVHLKKNRPIQGNSHFIINLAIRELQENHFSLESEYLKNSRVLLAENQNCFIIIQFKKNGHCKLVQEALAKLIRLNVKNIRNNIVRNEDCNIHDYGQGYVIASEQTVRETRKALKVHMNYIINNTVKRASRSIVLYIATPVLFFGMQPKISIYGSIIKEQLLKLTIKRKKSTVQLNDSNDNCSLFQVLWLFKVNEVPTSRWISRSYALQLIQDYDMDSSTVPIA